MSTQKPTLGRHVVALVDPDVYGQEEASAIITAVLKDGTVNLTVFLDNDGTPITRQRGVQLHASRAAAEKALGEHLRDLPRRQGEPEPTVRQVTRWVPAAFWPTVEKPAAKASAQGPADTPPAS